MRYSNSLILSAVFGVILESINHFGVLFGAMVQA